MGFVTSGQQNSLIYVSRLGGQTTNIAVGNVIRFIQTDMLVGDDISYDSTLGIFTCKPGKYELLASAGHCSGSGGALGYTWKYSTDKSNWVVIGCAGYNISPSNPWNDPQGLTMAIAPKILTAVGYFKVDIIYNQNITSVGAGSGAGLNGLAFAKIVRLGNA